ncbi:Plasma membrane fusion protein PRM1 [Mycena chlorophos]|uniref:Plasma membrane fusion protein PRM1 n=1 Tax=Mycena chlorophos TaxID=658473 RepID=A0A8H6VPN7_MYCCL|nr:Plasma membrane fusion protein PRM1 [Mycena chlorophos]
MNAALTNEPLTTSLKPYLELPHILSLTWLFYPILSLIIVIFRLQISLATSQNDVAGAKSDFLSSCQAAERAATAAASMPRYMAEVTNERIVDAVNDSMNAARAALILALTVMEAIINFIIDVYRSTFLCFLELVIQGGLAILIGAVQELNAVVGAAASGLRTTIQDAFGAANSALKGISDVASKFGISVPTLSVPDLSSLENVTLPSSFTDALTSLNNSLPTFNELKQLVDQFVDTPFELLKQDINSTFDGLSFNSSVFAVPAQNTLTFCDNVDTSFIDDLGHDLAKVTHIAIVILAAVIVILIALNCLLQCYRWRSTRRHNERTVQAMMSDPTIYLMASFTGTPTLEMNDHTLRMLQADGEHPVITRIANNLCARLRLSKSNQIRLHFFLRFIFHQTALACFLLGFFGLVSVELQLLAVRPLADKYSDQAAATAADFSNTIATSINASMFNQSAAYAASVNGHIDTIQSAVNDGLFGWVNTTTTTLNTTIENFYEDIQNAVNTVFNGTILDAPIQDFIKCIIGSKVDAIEEALTFLHNNLNIDIPRVNESVLVLSPASVNEATQPIADAAVGNGDGSGGIVGKLVNAYEASLRQEEIMFGIFMILWLVVVLLGLGFLLWDVYGRRWLERRRQRRVGADEAAVAWPEPGLEDGHMTLVTNEALPPPASTPRSGPFRFFNMGRSQQPQPDNHSWDSFFEKPKSTRSNISTKEISKPMKLVSSKDRGEVFLGDQATTSDASMTSQPDQLERRSTKWFARFANAMSKKQEAPMIEPYPSFSPNRNSASPPPRPTLRITINDEPTEIGPEAPIRSRWSVSPQNTARIPSASWTTRAPPLAWRHKPKASVPSNVPSVDANSIFDSVHGTGTPLAMPLHAGFEAPPATSHRRSLSVPYGGLAVDPFSDPKASSPVTQLLTTTGARRSSSINPFVTPFDDEHRVTVAHANPRQSIPTNPFSAVAV